MKFSIEDFKDFQVLSFTLPESGVITPDDLANIKVPDLDAKKGVILSGRGPIWLYAYLVHYLHPTAWVACFDPRIGGVIVQSHVKAFKVGQVISLE